MKFNFYCLSSLLYHKHCKLHKQHRGITSHSAVWGSFFIYNLRFSFFSQSFFSNGDQLVSNRRSLFLLSTLFWKKDCFKSTDLLYMDSFLQVLQSLFRSMFIYQIKDNFSHFPNCQALVLLFLSEMLSHEKVCLAWLELYKKLGYCS